MSRAPKETEASFQDAVLMLAHLTGYCAYHTFDSRRSAPGFPDIILAKPGKTLLCIELKTLTGKVTREQWQWLDVLHATKGIRAEVWRPDMWQHIEAILLHGMP